MKPQILNIYKPVGMGSSQVVSYFKHNLAQRPKKIGHLGTLDPFAEGVLLLGINGGQRLNDLIHSSYAKTYEAIGIMGEKTDTGDNTGKVIEECDVQTIEMDKLQKVAQELIGDYWQSPPQYSAAKFEGKPLHFYARKGIKIEKPKKLRRIYDFKVLQVEGKRVKFRVEVSSGTYIRSLFEDLLAPFNQLGHLEILKRTAIGPYVIENAQERNLWPDKKENKIFEQQKLPWCSVLPIKSIVLESASDLQSLSVGKALKLPTNTKSGQSLVAIGTDGELLAILENRMNGLHPTINFSAT